MKIDSWLSSLLIFYVIGKALGSFFLFIKISLLRTSHQLLSRVQRSDDPCFWPLVGNLWTFYKLHTATDTILEKLVRCYGDLCTLWLDSWPVIVISSLETAYELMQQVWLLPRLQALNNEDLIWQEDAISASRPEQILCRGRLALMPAGPKFRMLRKIYHKILNEQKSLALRGLQEQKSVVFINKLFKNPDEFFEKTEKFTLSIIFSAVYGVRLATLKHLPFLGGSSLL